MNPTATRMRVLDPGSYDTTRGLLMGIFQVLEDDVNADQRAKLQTHIQDVVRILDDLKEPPVKGQPIKLSPHVTLEMTLDEQAETAMSELRRVSRQIQELGKDVCQHDYSDGVNLGQGILEFVGACGKLASKFDEVGLCQDKESFFL